MAIELPDGRCESNEVLGALRSRAVHARELGYAVIDIAEEHSIAVGSRGDPRGDRKCLILLRRSRGLGYRASMGFHVKQLSRNLCKASP